MEGAKAVWGEVGLPRLKPQSPWFGYSLGEWSPSLDAAAQSATRGDYFETGRQLEKRRRRDVRMNAEVRHVKEGTPRARAKQQEVRSMQFGLFGSAQAKRGGPDVDSGQGFKDFVEYNVEAESLGFASTFVVANHFTA